MMPFYRQKTRYRRPVNVTKPGIVSAVHAAAAQRPALAAAMSVLSFEV